MKRIPKYFSLPVEERISIPMWLRENHITSKYDIYVTYRDGTSQSIHLEDDVPVMASLLKGMGAYGIAKAVTIEEISEYVIGGINHEKSK